MDTKQPDKTDKLVPFKPKGSGRGRSPELEKRISAKVLSLLKEYDLNRKQFAEKFGIDKSNFYRILDGEKGWTLNNLMKVARGFGIDVGQLFEEIPTVPLVALLTHDGFEYNLIGKESIGSVPYVPTKEKLVLEKIYALKIEGEGFELPFRQGWTIYLQKGVEPSEFIDGDYVIYCRENGQGVLRQLSFSDNGQVILRSLSKDEKDLIILKDHLKLCDKVITIDLV